MKPQIKISHRKYLLKLCSSQVAESFIPPYDQKMFKTCRMEGGRKMEVVNTEPVMISARTPIEFSLLRIILMPILYISLLFS